MQKEPQNTSGLDGSSSRFRGIEAIYVEDASHAAYANELASTLNLPIAKGAPSKDVALALHLDETGLSLVGDGMRFQGDFSRMAKRISANNLSRELLVKAAKVKRIEDNTPWAIDATAGMGEDALLLAAAGFEVDLYESDPIICALLTDALSRACTDPAYGDMYARMHVHSQDSITALAALMKRPDVIYLDPMFPAKTKASAAKKKFQLIHRLQQPCANGDELMQAAIAAHPRKIVVKRPLKGAPLTEAKPSYTLTGKAIRYDCYSFA